MHRKCSGKHRKTEENVTFEKSVGFVGLGGMGSGLVKNMLLKGVKVHVLDLDQEKVKLAESLGCDCCQIRTRHGA